MKTFKQNRSVKFMRAFACATIITLFAACGEDEKDVTPPVISDDVEAFCPSDCAEFMVGDTIEFCFRFTDDVELGQYNIEIHNDFDHHTHSTEAEECEHGPDQEPVNPWIYNQDFSIPSGTTDYTARQMIAIPSDVDAGDYHFMVRLTDHAGWQQIRSADIKLIK